MMDITFIYLHICDGLPFIHGHEPLIPSPSTAEVYYQLTLVIFKCMKQVFQPFHGECCAREKMRRDDHLL